MNYIAEVDLNNKDTSYNIIVEIEKGTNVKTELVPFYFNKLERVREVIGNYPYYYGCFPKTIGGDNDPLDCIIFTNKKLKKLDIVKVYPVGVIKTIDYGEVDDKIICVTNSMNVSKDIKKAMKFLKTYKGENANMSIDEKIYTTSEAIKLIKEANDRYNNPTSSSTLQSF